ncbi:hypothetical protein T484DRAFT_3380751 [Baffinella frigidus]|nr:hypothetical protein T484DRAFT_3380751 [Cryptophyta sp. CCMP2293]
MQSESGTTEAIPLDERTIAIDVCRNWLVPEGGGLVFEGWDFGGQAQYHTSHSPYLSPRCLVVLVFRPIGDDEQYLSVAQLMQDFLQTWFQMLHVHVPSSTIVLVCTRWGSPPGGVDLSVHQTRVSALCEEVKEAVAGELARLNATTRTELGHLRRQEEEVAKSIAAAEARVKQRDGQRGEGRGDEGGGHGRPDRSGEQQDGEQQDGEHLRVISEQLQKRLRVVTSEAAAGGDRDKDAPPVSMELADGRVHCVESVGGDGSTARAVRQALVQCANALPFMGQVCRAPETPLTSPAPPRSSGAENNTCLP